MANVRIVMTDHGHGEVFVDGAKVDKVQRVEFSADSRGCELNMVTLSLCAETVEVEGPAEIVGPKAALAAKFSDDYKRWLFLPWWRKLFGPSPIDVRMREGSTRTNVKQYGRNGRAPFPKPPPPANPPKVDGRG